MKDCRRRASKETLGLKSVAVGLPVAADLAYWPQREGLQEEALLAAYAAL